VSEQAPAAHEQIALTGLRDIALAEPVAWRPATAGWYVLFAVVSAAIARGLWLAWRRWRARAYRRTALAELSALEWQLTSPADRARAIGRINALVKRVRLSAAPRSRVASLSGAAWLSDLDTTWSGGRFSTGPGRLLADVPYRNADATPQVSEPDLRALTALVREWIRGHRA